MSTRSTLTLLAVMMMTVATRSSIWAATFGEEVSYLAKHTTVRVLANEDAMVALCPELQGRVMTSTFGGFNGPSLGYINRETIANQNSNPQFNNYGGEERLWIGPEGGQFSLFFPKARGFDFKDWVVPAPFNTQPWQVASSGPTQIVMRTPMHLRNYSGQSFHIDVFRRVALLGEDDLIANFGMSLPTGVQAVGYRTENTLTNVGGEAMSKSTGLLSIWMLSMFNPSPDTYVFAPVTPSRGEMRAGITDDYFGKVPADRLKVTDKFVVFKADGQWRSKIGLNRDRARNVAASIDLKNRILTVLRFDMPPDRDYVNSLWRIQEEPFAGDVVNSYNDGPVEPGGKSLGGFYELESSSPARELAVGESITHTQRILHFQGDLEALDRLSQALTGIALGEVRAVAAEM